MTYYNQYEQMEWGVFPHQGNLMDTLRGSGTNTGGPAAFRHGDRQAFANQLDRLLTARGRGDGGETDPGPAG